MSERVKEFTRPVQGEHWPIVLNARYVIAVEDSADGGAMVTVMGLDGVVWVAQSRAEVCAWLQDLPPS